MYQEKILKIAEQNLLVPAKITENELKNVLHTVMLAKNNFADIYLQVIYSESWMLEDGIVKNAGFDINKGFGLRSVSGEKTGFAYANDINLFDMKKAADTVKSITNLGQEKRIKISQGYDKHELYSTQNPLLSISESEKVSFLQNLDKEIRKDPKIKQATISLAGSYNIVLILNSEEQFIADARPLVRLNISVVAEKNGRIETGRSGGGGRKDYKIFLENDVGLHYAKEAVRIANVNLESVLAPAGIMPVVLSSGWPAVLLHESVGHGLEGDFNRKKTSVFADKIGEKIASSSCTIVDNGKIPNRRGSINVDDEGTLTQETCLIEKGILKGFLFDKLNANLMKTKSTGNGRRESYVNVPIPRMTNTYMLTGKYDPKEIIQSVDKGIYAVNFSGGQVDITSGKFVFSTSEAYLIEKGKVTKPIKGATLIGDGQTVLKKISMVGDDLALDSGIGTCGKDGQSVPVGVGQPTLKVDKLTIGGVFS